MKKLLFVILMLVCGLGASAQLRTGVQADSARMAEYRGQIGLDMSVPDFEVKKIDEKVIGPRLTAILKRLNDNCNKRANIDLLNIIQTKQVDGLSYARIKKMDFDTVKKIGNKITISYKTCLDSNNMGQKKAKLTFYFKNGVSDDKSTNQMISRYIKEK